MICPTCGKTFQPDQLIHGFCQPCWEAMPSIESVVGKEMAVEIEEFLSNPRRGVRRGRPQRHIDTPENTAGLDQSD